MNFHLVVIQQSITGVTQFY